MQDHSMTAAAATTTTTAVTARKCPACRNRRSLVADCKRCSGKGTAAVCGECHGAGLIPWALAPKGFMLCGHCGGVGLEPRPIATATSSAARAAAKRRTRLLPMPPREPASGNR